MTTFKTPLPEKYADPRSTHARNINQLIDCFTELREVVAGKKDEYTRGRIDEAKTCQGCSKERMTTLKEQLLGEILNCYSPDDTVNDYQDKIKAIIKRLL